jgi:hypothetical protein
MRFDSVLYKGDPDDEEARFDWAAKHQRNYTKRELMFDWDPLWGVLETYSYDSDTGVITIKRESDAKTLLDDNATWRGEEQTWRKKEDKWIRFASIPALIVEKWLLEEGINVLLACTDRRGVPNDHMRGVLKKLRDPEWAYLKTVDRDMGDGRSWGNYALGTPQGGNARGYYPTLPEDAR